MSPRSSINSDIIHTGIARLQKEKRLSHLIKCPHKFPSQIVLFQFRSNTTYSRLFLFLVRSPYHLIPQRPRIAAYTAHHGLLEMDVCLHCFSYQENVLIKIFILKVKSVWPLAQFQLMSLLLSAGTWLFKMVEC